MRTSTSGDVIFNAGDLHGGHMQWSVLQHIPSWYTCMISLCMSFFIARGCDMDFGQLFISLAVSIYSSTLLAGLHSRTCTGAVVQ